jgi:hypothetical protein
VHLLEFLSNTLREDRIVSYPPVRLDPDPARPRGAVLDRQTFVETIEHFLSTLRPDEPPTGPRGEPVRTRIQLVVDGSSTSMAVSGHATFLELDLHHPIVARAFERGGQEPGELAFVLLACYGYLNTLLGSVHDEHERTFQRHVLLALESGALRVIGDQTGS